MCPPSFIEIASKEEWNLNNLYYYYYCAYNNNSEDETTQKQDPIPLLGEWDNNNKEDKIQLFQNPIPLQGEWDNNKEDKIQLFQNPIPLQGEWDSDNVFSFSTDHLLSYSPRVCGPLVYGCLGYNLRKSGCLNLQVNVVKHVAPIITLADCIYLIHRV